VSFIPAGEEIVTSYHHYHYQFYGTVYRRDDLRATWSFDCACKRCADSTEMGTFVSAVACERCRLGRCLPKDPLHRQSEWECADCGVTVSAEAVKEKVGRFEQEMDSLAADDAPELERLLRRMRYALHENHYWVLEVKRKLIEIYGKKAGYELYKLPNVSLRDIHSAVNTGCFTGLGETQD